MAGRPQETLMGRQFDLDTLKRGHRQRDAALLLDLYADDAEVVVVDDDHPPSHPLVLVGRERIGEYLRELCEDEVVLEVGDEVVGDDRVALHVAFWRPDGSQALSSEVLDLNEDGYIRRETIVLATDHP
jgi:ketosteroid isomerase-like protein